MERNQEIEQEREQEREQEEIEINRSYLTTDDLMEFSRDDLLSLIEELQEENHRLKEREQERERERKREQERLRERERDRNEILNHKVEFVSFGSSNVRFLNSEGQGQGQGDSDKNANGKDSLTDQITEKGNGSLQAPNVSNYRNLFKKSVVLEYEADSPAFRNKVEIMV